MLHNLCNVNELMTRKNWFLKKQTKTTFGNFLLDKSNLILCFATPVEGHFKPILHFLILDNHEYSYSQLLIWCFHVLFFKHVRISIVYWTSIKLIRPFEVLCLQVLNSENVTLLGRNTTHKKENHRMTY